jgi:hypothetical protein
MTQEAGDGGFPVKSLLFAVLDEKTGEALLVVEAADAQQAKLRANWVAPFFGWRHFNEDQLQQVDECPDRTPTFFAKYFAAVDRGSDTLH